MEFLILLIMNCTVVLAELKLYYTSEVKFLKHSESFKMIKQWVDDLSIPGKKSKMAPFIGLMRLSNITGTRFVALLFGS